ncbi:MAG: helix-turn-helix domain-containing protein [Kangiellaceae bacterium]|nr:helix-turn-helix domain-containing protein [Kangiellaceae bacterium]MCW8998309.1 helix-turn-helix domain-containing protein [Kangiellaceae bacterium]MCW9018544.1 helix-turn-helix domain-containing protein [Kangiellaceae bacterium]
MTLGKDSDNRLVQIAERIAELGHPTRLLIFKHLVRAGHNGSPVGAIQEELQIPGSTLSHHIAKMVKVGLVKQVRESRTLYCQPQFDSLSEVIAYLQEECCINECCRPEENSSQ